MPKQFCKKKKTTFIKQNVNKIATKNDYPKRFNIIQTGHKHQTLWSIHYVVVCYCAGRLCRWTAAATDHSIDTTAWREILFFFVDRFTWRNRNRFVEAQTCTIVSIGIDVGQNGHMKLGLLTFRRQAPSQWLTKLKIPTKTKWMNFLGKNQFVLPILFPR